MDSVLPSFSTNNPANLKQALLLLLGLVLLGLLLELPWLGELRLHHEEPRRAIIAENMMVSGNYWVPQLMDRVYTAKPPAYNWLIIATSFWQSRIDEFSARVNSVLCHLALVALLVLGMRPYLGRLGLTFLGFAVLLAPELISKATLAEIELLFTLLVTASLWLWFWAYQKGARGFKLWVMPAVVVAFSFLTKREPALVFYYFSIAGFLLFKRDFWRLFYPAHLLCAALTLAIIGFWLWQMIDAVGLDALLHSSSAEVVSRGLGIPWWKKLIDGLIYPFRVALGAFPFSLLLLPLLWKTVRQSVSQRYGDLYYFCVIALVINLPIYLMRGDIAVRYFLPMIPTLLVLCALVYETMTALGSEKNRMLLRVLQLTSVLLVLLALTLNLVLLREVLGYPGKPADVLPTWLSYSLGGGALLISIVMCYRSFRVPRLTGLWLSVSFIIVYRIVYFDVLLPREVEKLDRERNLPLFIESINRVVPKDRWPIATYGSMPRDFWFYMGYGKLETEYKRKNPLEEGFFVMYQDKIKDFQNSGFEFVTIDSLNYRGRTLVFGRVIETASDSSSVVPKANM